jgi:methylmalonyl-CoA mutase N-terminal domain/subunit
MINDGEKKIVGMNCYTTEEDEQSEPTFKVDEEVERIAIERIVELRAKRDAKRYEKAIAAFGASAQAMAKSNLADFNGHGLMETAIEAARADATTGEMMGVMKTAFGWAAPHEY